jgi:hypothetical protein
MLVPITVGGYYRRWFCGAQPMIGLVGFGVAGRGVGVGDRDGDGDRG